MLHRICIGVDVSIHSLTQRETQQTFPLSLHLCVSIHSLTQRETLMSDSDDSANSFQSTPSRRGRRDFGNRTGILEIVSIHSLTQRETRDI